MTNCKSNRVKQILQQPDIHHKWTSSYRTGENDLFYELSFDYIANLINPPRPSQILDAGCGSCTKSILLAKRGFFVVATDLSESVLRMARKNVHDNGLQDKVKLERQDLLSLSFGNETFKYILCWGVLMHIPNLDKAISELSRVLKPGGTIVLSEANMFSVQGIALTFVKTLLRKGTAEVKRTPAGIEYWKKTSSGILMTRRANIPWLIREFEKRGCTVKKRIAGQFTELYTAISSRPLKKLIHIFNNLWFRHIRIPHLAFGNIIILQKQV